MKKNFFVKVNLVGLMVFSLISAPAFANTSDINSQALKQMKIQTAVDAGLSEEDALFMVQAEQLLQEIADSGEVIDLDVEQTLSDEYVRNNKWEFRERVLDGDRPAMKTALLSVDRIMTNGFEELNNELNQVRSFDSTDATLSSEGNFENLSINYPDGSSLTFSAGTIDDPNPEIDQVELNSTKYNGPWNQSTQFGRQTIAQPNEAPGKSEAKNSYAEWSFNSGAAYGKVRGILDWTYATGNTTSYDDNKAFFKKALLSS